MTWENDLDQFYQELVPKRVFREKAEVDIVLNGVVIPALERISCRLKLHAKNVKVRAYRYKATISFGDEISMRSTFGVELDIKYGAISFP